MGVQLYWPGNRVNMQILVIERLLLECQYPTLRLFQHGDQAIVYGTYRLVFEKVTIETYSIIIYIPTEYPDVLPVLYPLGFYPPRGPIPDTDGNHINCDGSACVAYRGEARELFPLGSTLVDFIQRLVHPYLIGLTSYLRGTGWPWGERSHGAKGAVEWIQEKLDTVDPSLVDWSLKWIISGQHLDMTAACPCGSRRKIRRCHGRRLTEMASTLVRQR